MSSTKLVILWLSLLLCMHKVSKPVAGLVARIRKAAPGRGAFVGVPHFFASFSQHRHHHRSNVFFSSRDQAFGRRKFSTSLHLTVKHESEIPYVQREQPGIRWNSTSEFATHIHVELESNQLNIVDIVEAALREKRKQEGNVTELSAFELIQMGAVWYLASDAPKDAKPVRWTTPGLNLTAGDYLRVHHTPRRFPAVYEYDWSRPAIDTAAESTRNSPGVRIACDVEKGWIVIDKPSLVPVHPTVDNAKENVASCLRQALSSSENRDPYVSTPQRLDQNTSGLFVAATSKTFANYYASLLRNKTRHRLLDVESSDGIHKLYRCLVCLIPAEDSSVAKEATVLQRFASTGKILRHYLEPSIRAPKRFVDKVPENAADLTPSKTWAESLLRVRKASAIYTLVGNEACEALVDNLWNSRDMVPPGCRAVMELEVELLTGRTHQIRGQFQAMGFPLVGDSMYGGTRSETGSLALQCCELEFLDPDCIVDKTGAESLIRSKRWNTFRLQNAWWSPFLDQYDAGTLELPTEAATTLANDIGLVDVKSQYHRVVVPSSFDKPARPDLLPERVSLSPGKHKYVLIRGTHTGDENVQWFVKSAAPWECGGAYHGNVAQDLREWIEAAGYCVEVVGGGRIDFQPQEGLAVVYGFSYAFGRGDHEKVASMISGWSKGEIIAKVDNTEGLY